MFMSTLITTWGDMLLKMPKRYLNKLKGIKESVKLAPYTTFKIGGPAKYFYIAKTIDNLVKAVQIARELKISYFVLGGGSNILVSDKGFDGLVIKIKDLRPEIKDATITAGAGLALAKLVDASIKEGLTGLEWAIGIPGTVGGAVRNNAGAFGQNMGDMIESVRVLRGFGPVKLNNKQCQFGYRDSIFKHNKDIILEVKLKLRKGDKKESKRLIGQYLSRRKETQPLKYPSAGCVFKNPAGYSAGQLIDKCGLKAKQIGGAQISQLHANFIINRGRAKARHVVELIEFIKQKVKDTFNIELEEEIEYVGF
jgi:UDP-N-acetylmuramate dehydrogenase